VERRYSYDEGMVLRTVYLPKDLDERLRRLAYEARTSKNEIIRNLINQALDTQATQKTPEVTTEVTTKNYARAVGAR